MKYLPSLFAALTLAAASLPAPAAGSLACRGGYQHATLKEGSVATVNLSDIKQSGQICLTLQDDQGAVVFEDCGSLLGLVTRVDPDTGATTLSHKAVFDTENGFQTAGDSVLYFVPVDPADPVPCAFNAGESFTRLKAGTGIFHGGSLDVRADGVVSYCPGNNRNSFSLSGEACLKRQR